MLKVDQYDYIRTAHRVYGKKIRQIAKETGHFKNTIKRFAPNMATRDVLECLNFAGDSLTMQGLHIK
jgi:hypothetical protein